MPEWSPRAKDKIFREHLEAVDYFRKHELSWVDMGEKLGIPPNALSLQYYKHRKNGFKDVPALGKKIRVSLKPKPILILDPSLQPPDYMEELRSAI